MAQLQSGKEVITPTDADSALAKHSSRQLAVYLEKADGLRLEVKTDTMSEELLLPTSALRLLLRSADRDGAGQRGNPDAASGRADLAASGRPAQCLSSPPGQVAR